MTTLGVTGVRNLTKEQAAQVEAEVWELDRQATRWHIGDASGVDQVARQTIANGQLIEHNADGRQPWQLAARSTKMVMALAESNGTLHAWASAPPPEGLKPCKKWKNAQGSGTWGTVALAAGLGVTVELHWLGQERELPDWL
jgi:hypothetical protein